MINNKATGPNGTTSKCGGDKVYQKLFNFMGSRRKLLTRRAKFINST